MVEILLQNSEHVPSIDEVHKEAVRARHREKKSAPKAGNSPAKEPSTELSQPKAECGTSLGEGVLIVAHSTATKRAWLLAK